MRPSPRRISRFVALPAAGLCAAAILVGVPAAALAATPAPTPTAAAPAPSTPPTPTSAPTPVPAPVAGRIKLVLQRIGGNPAFAVLGQRIVVRGIVTPYVGGQTVRLSVYRDGRKIAVKTVSVQAGRSSIGGNGAGQFHLNFVSGLPGLVQVRGAHYATPQQGAFSGRSPSVQYVTPNLGPGGRGPSVRLLQSELDVLHYAVPLSGVLDEGTGRALIAYRKMTGLARAPYAGVQVWSELARGAGAFHVRYPGDGRHVEADLTKQVLAEIEPGGRVRTIYTMSSGKPSTPTVIGRFQVYLKTPGFNSEGMFESNYFIRGYAIHGYAEVPTYAASHGCLRVPIPDAPAIYAWVRVGTRVDVYNEYGGGSGQVRNNAGP